MKYTLGIDFGSLSGRCVAVNIETGEEVASDVFEYPHAVMNQQLPDGTPLGIDWQLQHPQDYIDTILNVIPNTMKKAGIKADEVIGIGTDFTGCTMLPVDKKGVPLCFYEKYKSEPNAYVKLWKHHSAQKYADKLNKIALERGETFLKRYGEKISSEWLFPKIWQTLDEAPEVYEETYSFMEAADWIVFYLTGHMTRNSSALGFKAIWSKKEGYPKEDFFKALDPRLEKVVSTKLKGDIVLAGNKAGGLREEVAKKAGLNVGIPVAVGTFDAAGATLGAGIIEPGSMLIMMGTSSCHEVLGTTEMEVPGICGVVEDGIVPGLVGYEAGQSCVGDHFQWFVEQCVSEKYYAQAEHKGISIHTYLSELAQKQEIGEHGLIALDWWNGNRSVLVNGRLSGMIVGLTLNSRPEDIYRALIEATAYGTRLIIETFEKCRQRIDEIVIAGGIAQKNPFIMQLYADVIGKKIKIAGSKQNAALSSAIWAALAAKEQGGYSDIKEAVSHMSNVRKKVYFPNKENHEAYELLYVEYLKLHDYFGRGGNHVMEVLKNRQEEVFKGKEVHRE